VGGRWRGRERERKAETEKVGTEDVERYCDIAKGRRKDFYGDEHCPNCEEASFDLVTVQG
jgi:hypothetical protein